MQLQHNCADKDAGLFADNYHCKLSSTDNYFKAVSWFYLCMQSLQITSCLPSFNCPLIFTHTKKTLAQKYQYIIYH